MKGQEVPRYPVFHVAILGSEGLTWFGVCFTVLCFADFGLFVSCLLV